MTHHPRKQDVIWISGANPVRETLQGDPAGVDELLVARKASDPRTREIIELAQRRFIPLRQVSREELSRLVGHDHHQGFALRAETYGYTDLEAMLARGVKQIDPLVALDSLQDPQNLGAILRSGCFLGAGGVILPKDRSVPVTSAVIKVAAGATAYLPVARVTNLVRSLERLKESGFWIAGLEPGGEMSIYDVDLSVPLVLVVGNEQKGLRPLVRGCCDLRLGIPGAGPLLSLNAAVATAIALSEVMRQRSVKHDKT
jgi:23S rRNA (guanosine2251-2'-O)-methyltransferase